MNWKMGVGMIAIGIGSLGMLGLLYLTGWHDPLYTALIEKPYAFLNGGQADFIFEP
ncbi:hypothetical protein [Desmospora activa]|nr:hypothetical protein [Desmospora activa]